VGEARVFKAGQPVVSLWLIMFDLIVRGGFVLDGSGAPPFRADVGVAGGAVRRVGDLSGERADLVIDASGLAVAPGFIDPHNHSDLSIFEDPAALNYVAQGVTTLVVGNCGSSPAPVTGVNRGLIHELLWGEASKSVPIRWSSFSEYLGRLEELRKSVNVAALVGHGTVRSAVMGCEARAAADREVREMEGLVAEAMEAGALGMSLGLMYVPGMYAGREELVRLARVVGRYGGVLAAHMRNEGAGLIDSVVEVVGIAREAGVSLEISHLKAAGRRNWGLARRALKLIEYYVWWRGLDVSADAYPYEASSTFLSALLPGWVREGGAEALLRRLRDSRVVERLREELRAGLMGERFIGWGDVIISSSPARRELEGLSLADAARELGVDPLSAVIELLTADRGLTEVVIKAMDPGEVADVIAHPLVAVGSDGLVMREARGRPHPRSYGTFPRVLGRFVRELRVLSLPEAVRKMTSLPARKFGLLDRGLLRPGCRADIVVFDPTLIRDTATYEEPARMPEGVVHVVVNGEPVLLNGEFTGAAPGSVLRRC